LSNKVLISVQRKGYRKDKYIVKDVFIEQNVWIGADVSIMPGVKIGEGSIVAACSVITKDIPPFAVVGGNPAKILKYRDIENYRKNLEAERIYFKMKKEGKTITNDKERCIKNNHKNNHYK
jgi:acetyltransferase-like isoleucine patch superfamily enzyme